MLYLASAVVGGYVDYVLGFKGLLVLYSGMLLGCLVMLKGMRT